jgi:hypothetical protein
VALFLKFSLNVFKASGGGDICGRGIMACIRSRLTVSGQVDAAAALCDDSFPLPPLPCVMIHSQHRCSLVRLSICPNFVPLDVRRHRLTSSSSCYARPSDDLQLCSATSFHPPDLHRCWFLLQGPDDVQQSAFQEPPIWSEYGS